jgi:hypothetical protein
MRDARFSKCFWAPNNVIKYDGKDYRLACRAGGVDDDLFIIQFLPIYLANMARAWLDLPRITIDSWEGFKDIFRGNLQGTYV